MAIIAEVMLRGVSPEEYDAVRARTGWLARTPAGGLAHLTWWEGTDCRNVDGWESEAAFAEFGQQRLGPAMAELGIDVQPEVTFHPAHEVYTPQRGVVAATATPETALADNVALVRSGYAAFGAGDIPGLLAGFAPGVVWTVPDSTPFGGRFVGREATGGFFAGLSQYFAELRVEPDTYLDAGSTVVVLGHHRGRSVAGADFDVPFAHVWTLHEGAVTGFTEYLDTAKVNDALTGAQPSGAAAPTAVGAPA